MTERINLKLVILAVFVVGVCWAERLPNEAPWQPCTELSSTLGATGFHVYVTGCNSTEVRCKLPRGTNQTISATFNTTLNSTRLERTIVARFPRMLRGNPVEIPYGGSVDACQRTKKLVDNISCAQSGGLLSNTSYTHESTFQVFSNAPKTSLIVRYMLRTPMESGSIIQRRRQNWQSHPGPYFLCAEIPVMLV